MCGRYVLKATLRELEEKYGAVPEGTYSFTANYNVAPSLHMPVIFEKEGKRLIGRYRWGLVPFWAKEVNTGYSMINARAESLAEKKSFSRPFQSQRCIVPANGFYEWQKAGSSKIPHFITSASSPLMHFAGLYEQWKGPDGEIVNSYTIITTEANKPVSELHDRMPAMLLPGEFETWLDPENRDTAVLQELLRPWPDDDIRLYRVSTDVNNVRNNGEHLIEPHKDLFS
jgi:putative SOS response-associated peptidase YedK